MIDAVTRSGYCPRTTPVDVLMAGPTSMHLAAADNMQDDGDCADNDLVGFQEADFASEYAAGIII